MMIQELLPPTDIAIAPEEMYGCYIAYPTLDQLILSHALPKGGTRLPVIFNQSTGFYENPDNLIHNDQISNGVGVVTSWVKPSDALVNAEFVGSSYTPQGLDWLIRNILAHPEIKYLIIAGANITSSIVSGSTALIALLKEYSRLVSSNSEEGPKELANFAIEQQYNLTPEVLRMLWHFFTVVPIINLFDQSLVKVTLNDHWQAVNGVIETLDQNVPPRKAIYLRYPEKASNGEWTDDNSVLQIDATRIPIEEAHRHVIAVIRRFGVTKFGEPIGSNRLLKSVLERLSLAVTLNPKINPMTDAPPDLAAYLIQFTEPDLQGIAAYTYGNKIGPRVDVVVSELAEGEGYGSINLLTQSEITDKDPDCLVHIDFTLRNGQLYVYAHIRSNDMLGAWPLNAKGVLYLSQLIKDKLEARLGREISIANVSTFSESAHIRDVGLEQASTIDLPTQTPWQLESNFVVAHAKRRNSNTIVVTIDGRQIELMLRVQSKIERIGQIVNQLVYEHRAISTPEQIIRTTLALTELLLTGELQEFKLPAGMIEQVIDERVKRSTDSIIAGIAQSLANSPIGVTVDSKRILPGLSISLTQIPDAASTVEVNNKAIELVLKILQENLFGKSALVVGDGSLNSINKVEIGGREIAIPYLQVLLGQDRRLHATVLVERPEILRDYELIVQWVSQVVRVIIEKVNQHLPSEKQTLTAGSANIQLRSPWANLEELNEADRNYRVPVYVEDPRGNLSVAGADKRIVVTVRDTNGHSETIPYEIDLLVSGQENAFRITADLILRRHLLKDPGHIAYITRTVYVEVAKLTSKSE